MLGGGTGKLLEQLDDLVLSIHYLEKSSQMIGLAKKRKLKKSSVNFINADILEYPLSDYQVIITPFVLDVFDEQHLSMVIDKLYAALQNEGLWIYTDFQIPHQSGYGKRMLLKIMNVFFKITAKLQATKLYDAEKMILAEQGLMLVDHKVSIGGLVKTFLIKKRGRLIQQASF